MSITFQTVSSPNRSRGRSAPISGIIIHHWGVLGQSHDGVVRYLCRDDGNSSAHYVVSAGKITQLVSTSDTAWHCPGQNSSTIGIECRPECGADDVETVAQLIADLWDEYGHLPLSGHQDHYATTCPGKWEDKLTELADRATELQNGAPSRLGATDENTNTLTEENMHFIKSRQTNTIYAVTPTDVVAMTSAKVWGDLVKTYGLENSYECSLDDGDIAAIKADADRRRGRLAAAIAAAMKEQ